MTASPGKQNAISATITFEPDNKVAESLPGENLLDCARRAGVKIASVCGGRGICKSCMIQFKQGVIPEPSDDDIHYFSANKLQQGWRRACQVEISSACRVNIPVHSRAESVRHQLDGADYWVQPDPVVQAFRLVLKPPSLYDASADATRLMSAINSEFPNSCRHLDFAVLQTLPEVLRRYDWSVQAVVRFGEIIAVQPGKCRLVGLAVDIGTTNIGIFLLDLRNGTTIASTGIENPQSVYGGDVVTRITIAKQSPAKALDMQRLVIAAINETVAGLCQQRNLLPEHIVDAVIAGNTAMHHLFLGLPVDKLGMAPFVPVVVDAVDIKARELNIKTATGAYVHVMENIAGYIGGDHTAMLLGIRADREARTVVALDIGTNTEISIIHQGHITSLSCPSGPALEGGHITSGMRAAMGAIESISVAGGEVHVRTIGGGPALGLCGSAVIDATAAFYRDGGITANGRIIGDYKHSCGDDKQRMFVFHDGEPPVVFTQADVRAVQLAKGAIRAGIELLLDETRLDYEQIDKIIIAGAFGAYINTENACVIGMLPDVAPDRIEQVGNAAGIGAKLALLSYPLRIEAQSLATRSRYFELAGSRQFTAMFMKHIGFPLQNQTGAESR